MLKVLERLHNDHRRAAELVDILANCLDQIGGGENADFELMRDVVHYLVRFNDTLHHPCEDLLYARMSDKSPSLAKLFAGLGEEHSKLINLGKNLADALSLIADGGMTLRTEILALGNDYISDFRQHMAREEHSLFPMIEKNLDAAESAEVLRILEAEQDPMFGPILDEEFKSHYDHIQMLKAG